MSTRIGVAVHPQRDVHEPVDALHEWASTFERYWSHQLLRVKQRAEAAAKNTIPKPHGGKA